MIAQQLLEHYVASRDFLSPLGLPVGSKLSLSPLGQGEYNVNYRFDHPITGQPLVLRINTGSQMGLSDQVGYEYAALQDLEASGRTPRPLFCDGSKTLLPYGILVMEWLPGRPLRYETDLPQAAEILADIHAVPVPARSQLIRPQRPAMSIYRECLSMAEHYFTWERADRQVARLLETLAEEISHLPLAAPAGAPSCMVNTELNSGNFLIQDGGHSHLVDWEKPLISEPAQDLGHFLAPTTTFWKTDTILTPEEIAAFVERYRQAAAGRWDTSSLRERLPLYFTVTCLRGVTWCAMALREYEQPGRDITNADTLKKIRAYLTQDLLGYILEHYVRRDFLKGLKSR